MDSMGLWLIINGLLLLSSYLLGSIPVGYLTGRTLKGIDIREHGSGSTGATNVLRTLGRGPGLAVFLADVLKGVGAIALVRGSYHPSSWLSELVPNPVDPQVWLPWMVVLGGLAAILGHSKSVWINFTGGKSVATSLGTLLATSWPVGLGAAAVFAVALSLFRIVSLSSIAGAIAVSVLMVLIPQPLPYRLFALAAGIYVIWRHQANIQRLLAGTEPRLGQKSPVETEIAG